MNTAHTRMLTGACIFLRNIYTANIMTDTMPLNTHTHTSIISCTSLVNIASMRESLRATFDPIVDIVAFLCPKTSGEQRPQANNSVVAK